MSEALAALMLLAVILAVGAFFLLTAYGIVLLIFRHAFGVELPDLFALGETGAHPGAEAGRER